MDHLALYSRNCKFCKSLDPDEIKEFPACHYDTGNKDCPAIDVQLAVVGLVGRHALEFNTAKKTANIGKQASILQLVAKKSQAFQFKFQERTK
jgi:hypothetical protein